MTRRSTDTWAKLEKPKYLLALMEDQEISRRSLAREAGYASPGLIARVLDPKTNANTLPVRVARSIEKRVGQDGLFSYHSAKRPGLTDVARPVKTKAVPAPRRAA